MVVEARPLFQLDEDIEAIGYIRQSEERSDKKDISEQTQLKQITGFCELNNWKLVKVFKDIDYSGFKFSYTKRPGMMDALDYANKNSKVKKFVIFNLSRLTRRRNDFSLIFESLKKMGIDLCSAAEFLDFSTASGRLVANMFVDFNEYHSDNLSDITLSTKKTNAEKGRWNGGPAPFGLIKVNDVFVADGENSVWVKKSFEMALQGKGPYLIAKYLNQKEVYTKTGVEWSARRVRYMLSNPTYAAMQEWDGEFYPLLGFKKLVSWEDFQYIQKTLFGDNKAWKGKQRQLLSTILKCPVCGGKMHSRMTTNKKQRRYVCSRKYAEKGCSSPIFDTPSLDAAIIKLIHDVSQQRFNSNDLSVRLSSKEDDIHQTMNNLHDEYEKIEKAKQRVFDDFYIEQKLSEEQFSKLMKRYDGQLSDIQKKLDKIPIPKSNSYGDYGDLLSHFGDVIENNLEESEKRLVTELLIEKIVPNKEVSVSFKWGETYHVSSIDCRKRVGTVYYY
jgi:DNA invertase Pin-like site-specific DNA recombinase/ssDNA-binding Zn-finger/Zn-ribbon topoisomerase 1